MTKWTINKIEEAMLKSVYNDKSKMQAMIEGSLRIYKEVTVDNAEVKNRIRILEQLKSKYQ